MDCVVSVIRPIVRSPTGGCCTDVGQPPRDWSLIMNHPNRHMCLFPSVCEELPARSKQTRMVVSPRCVPFQRQCPLDFPTVLIGQICPPGTNFVPPTSTRHSRSDHLFLGCFTSRSALNCGATLMWSKETLSAEPSRLRSSTLQRTLCFGLALHPGHR